MHPELMQMAHQSHVDDLRREAAQQRRDARLLRRSSRRRTPATAPVLSPAVQSVLVFAERQPSRSQVEQVLDQLKVLQGDVVTALFHHRPDRLGALVNESGSHSLSLPMPDVRMPAQRAPSEAEQHLSEVVGALQAAGHDTSGELVAGAVPKVLAEQVRERRPEAVILLTSRHRLAHLAHRDVERRLRKETSVPVIAVTEGRTPHVL